MTLESSYVLTRKLNGHLIREGKCTFLDGLTSRVRVFWRDRETGKRYIKYNGEYREFHPYRNQNYEYLNGWI